MRRSCSSRTLAGSRTASSNASRSAIRCLAMRCAAPPSFVPGRSPLTRLAFIPPRPRRARRAARDRRARRWRAAARPRPRPARSRARRGCAPMPACSLVRAPLRKRRTSAICTSRSRARPSGSASRRSARRARAPRVLLEAVGEHVESAGQAPHGHAHVVQRLGIARADRSRRDPGEVLAARAATTRRAATRRGSPGSSSTGLAGAISQQDDRGARRPCRARPPRGYRPCRTTAARPGAPRTRAG